ncbi:hypothetical protein G7Y79_00032g067240 [Physcia stellaris]|nr:hypothetical protein G7Y79_00032g067240 [Physcia stellaris]
MQYSKAFVAGLFGLAPCISAHMIMKTPNPFAPGSLNNSPLDASGSDYPCKQRPGVYGPPASKNVMPIGSPQTLSFTGSATHGGGSCQIALSKDQAPTKDSSFKVILSIEGGCPAAAAGNIGGDPNGSGASQFQFTIPEDVEPGSYTLAWTWFNKVGNREMYMNCAPITVTGGSKKRDTDNTTAAYELEDNILGKRGLDSLPDMFKANIGSVSGDCHTAESVDLQFPDPGKTVQKHGSGPLGPPTGSCKGASASGGDSSAGSAGSSSGSASSGGQSGSAGSSSGTASSGGQSGSAGSSSGSASSGSQSGGAGAGTPSASPVASAAPAGGAQAGSPSPSAAPAAGSGSSTGSATPEAGAGAGAGSSSGSAAGSSSSGGMQCSSDGAQFQLSGGPMQAVAPGTKCQNGAIVAAAVVRSAKFAKGFQG